MQQHNYIVDFYPTKAQFVSMEEVSLLLSLRNRKEQRAEIILRLEVLHLGKETMCQEMKIELKPMEETCIKLSLPPKKEVFAGFGADVFLYEGDEIRDTASTAFDVVDSYKRAIRYGFLSDFYSREAGKNNDLHTMCKLHLNVVQFYDWMYRHDELIPPGDEFNDLMGRTISLSVVKEKIEVCHQYGMQAMAYGAVYAASLDFYEKHREWGLYDNDGNALCFIRLFYIMNIAKECPWHDHILQEYVKAVGQLDFDGIHMDTYGFPKTAISMVGKQREIIHLEQHFPDLINDAKKALTELKPEACVIFNNVGNWPVHATAGASQDAVYIEVWSPYERYHHLPELIKEAKKYGQGKPVVLAAYMKPFLEADIAQSEAQNATLLATAAIVSNGAFQLVMGEDRGILTQGYYVDYTELQPSFFDCIRGYYDFIIRYSNIFYRDSLEDVSMTHTGGDNQEYLFSGAVFSSYGEAGKVWTILREDKSFKTIHFINLTSATEDFWNRGKMDPQIIRNIEATVQIRGKVKGVYTSAPDCRYGREQVPEYSLMDSGQGEGDRRLWVRLPSLGIWRILWVELENT